MVHFIKLTSDQGLIEEQFRYAQMCENGEGGSQDFIEMKKYYEMAAANKLPEAIHEIIRLMDAGYY